MGRQQAQDPQLGGRQRRGRDGRGRRVRLHLRPSVLQPGAQDGRVGHHAQRAGGVIEHRPGTDHVAEPHCRARENDPGLRDIPRREVLHRLQEPRRLAGIAIGRFNRAHLGLGHRGDGEDQAHRRTLAQVEALDLEAGPGRKLGAERPVVALDREQSELDEAQRIDGRRYDDTAPRSFLQEGKRPLVHAKEVTCGPLEQAVEGAPRAVVARQRIRARGVVAHADDPVARDRRAHRRDTRLERPVCGVAGAPRRAHSAAVVQCSARSRSPPASGRSPPRGRAAGGRPSARR